MHRSWLNFKQLIKIFPNWSINKKLKIFLSLRKMNLWDKKIYKINMFPHLLILSYMLNQIKDRFYNRKNR